MAWQAMAVFNTNLYKLSSFICEKHSWLIIVFMCLMKNTLSFLEKNNSD